MADRIGKCTNYGGCTLAYRNEQITAAGNFACPECGQPLQEVIAAPARSRKPLMILGGVAVAAVVVIAGIMMIPGSGEKPVAPTPDQTEAPEPAPAPTPSPEPVIASTPVTPPVAPLVPPPVAPPPEPIPTPAPEPVTPKTPPPTPVTPPEPEAPPANVSAEQSVDVNLTSAENQRVRQEVLSRIDAMPNLNEANKVKLHDRVNRARGMGKIITIPFSTGSTGLAPQAADQLAEVVRAPQITKLLDDPTAVFVILGFADKRGDEKANLKVSLARADSVLQTLRDKCGLQNVMQAVGMGGSQMFDAGDHAKNRIVEVWVVLP